MKLEAVKESTNKNKKFMATFNIDGTVGSKKKVIHFGAKGYRDFTLINNKKSKFYIEDPEKRNKVKSAYQARHKKDLLTANNKKGLGAGALSYYILWTKPTLKEGLTNYLNKFN